MPNKSAPGTIPLLATVIDFAIFYALTSAGVDITTAEAASFVTALTAALLYKKLKAPAHNAPSHLTGVAQRAMILLLAFLLRSSLLTLLAERLGWPSLISIIPAILATSAVIHFGFALCFRPHELQNSEDILKKTAAGAILFALALRLAYIGQIELLPEEAYYWNYARHLDIGYLDHPPMVAWLIWFTTNVFGTSEFSLRLGAILCWAATAFFCYRLTCNLFDRSAALRAVLLLAVVPFFFFVGMFMTPDAPLVACWAMALYFLERSLLAGRKTAWWGVGIAMGIGMLSKYTIALLAPAALIFMLFDRPARRWFFRPEPYLAAALGLLIFSPVIIWNANNHWASFVFQGTRRVSGSADFSLHVLIGSIVLLITPAGILSAAKYLCGYSPGSCTSHVPQPYQKRNRLFAFSMVAAPLSVFVLFSLMHTPKLNWAGPLWLAVLPALAYELRPQRAASAFDMLVRKIWTVTFPASFAFFGLGLLFLTVGFPGFGYPQNTPLLGWRDLSKQIDAIEDEYEEHSGIETVIVGLDKYNLASEIAFYDEENDDQDDDDDEDDDEEYEDEYDETTGRHLFGENSLMYAYWSPPRLHEGRTLLLVGDDAHDLTKQQVTEHFDSLGPIGTIAARNNGKLSNVYYYRIGYGYRFPPAVRMD